MFFVGGLVFVGIMVYVYKVLFGELLEFVNEVFLGLSQDDIVLESGGESK